MSDDNIDNIREADEGNDPLVRGELLLSRLVDGEASERDWEDFRTIAGRGAGGLWRALAEAQRDQAVLSIAVGESVRAAERVGLPGSRPAPSEGVIARIVPWAGWAAAACVGIVWAIGLIAARPGMTSGTGNLAGIPGGIVRPASYEDAWNECVRRGKEDGVVVGEVPERVVVSTSARADGRGYEIVTLRQVVEKRTVTDLYRVGRKESGAPVLVPASIPAVTGGGSFD
jgi:hypothetical protein